MVKPDETVNAAVELGRKIYDEIIARLPAELDKEASKRALKKLRIENQDELMIAITLASPRLTSAHRTA